MASIRRDILLRNFGTIVPQYANDAEKDFQYAMANMQLSIHDNIPCIINVENNNFLYIGSVGVAYNQEKLDEFGITYILNATYNMLNKYESVIEPDSRASAVTTQTASVFDAKQSGKNPLDENSYNYKYKYLRVPLRDSRSQNIIAHFEECFQFIDQARCNQAKVLVHCHQGKSRSTAIIMAYLIHHTGLSFDDAFRAVKSARPIAKLNDGFTRQLKEYEASLRGDPAITNSSSSNVDVRMEANSSSEQSANDGKRTPSPITAALFGNTADDLFTAATSVKSVTGNGSSNVTHNC